MHKLVKEVGVRRALASPEFKESLEAAKARFERDFDPSANVDPDARWGLICSDGRSWPTAGEASQATGLSVGAIRSSAKDLHLIKGSGLSFAWVRVPGGVEGTKKLKSGWGRPKFTPEQLNEIDRARSALYPMGTTVPDVARMVSAKTGLAFRTVLNQLTKKTVTPSLTAEQVAEVERLVREPIWPAGAQVGLVVSGVMERTGLGPKRAVGKIVSRILRPGRKTE